MESSEQDVLQRNLINFILKDVFNTIDVEDVLRIKGTNVWEHKGRNLTPDEVNLLREEARIFKNSKLWEILKNELKYHAQKSMFEKSQTPQDIVAAKLLIYLTDVIQGKLEKMV